MADFDINIYGLQTRSPKGGTTLPGQGLGPSPHLFPAGLVSAPGGAVPGHDRQGAVPAHSRS